MDRGCWLWIPAAALTAAVLLLWCRWRMNRMLSRLNDMLDDAVRGEFQETRYDESRLSAAEARLRQYLTASAVTAGRLREEKETVKTLIADISHQTKTPIANVLLYAQLLEEQVPEDCRPYTEALNAQVQKLRSLIDGMVKTSRLEAGVLALHPRPGSLGPLLEEAAAQFAAPAAEKGLTLTLVPTEARAVFDAKWTAEAVCNLLDNAVKYTPAGGRVTLSAVPYELFCRVDVDDTGPGIPEEEHARIFQRFFRGEAAWETEGVGVGLYLVRQIAGGQGGYVKVFSRPGEGAKFSLFLPRR